MMLPVQDILSDFLRLHGPDSWRLQRMPVSGDVAERIGYDTRQLEPVGQKIVPSFLGVGRAPRCLVASRREARLPGFDRARQMLVEKGWPVVVRPTGGTCVPQGPGMLNFSLVHPKLPGWQLEDGYRLICALLQQFLAEYGLQADIGEVTGAFCDGRYNLQVEDRKLVGTAQRWAGGNRRQAAVLVHACLLVDMDLVEATDRVNDLYRACGQPTIFHPGACTTLRDCLDTASGGDDLVAEAEQRLIDLLCRSFALSPESAEMDLNPAAG